jgi:hypothetical protein
VVDSRSAWGEDRVYFRDTTGWLRHLPAAWTSAAPRDPFVEMSAGRSHFRIEDLLQLAVLIARQMQDSEAETGVTPARCQVNCVHIVK